MADFYVRGLPVVLLILYCWLGPRFPSMKPRDNDNSNAGLDYEKLGQQKHPPIFYKTYYQQEALAAVNHQVLTQQSRPFRK